MNDSISALRVAAISTVVKCTDEVALARACAAIMVNNVRKIQSVPKGFVNVDVYKSRSDKYARKLVQMSNIGHGYKNNCAGYRKWLAQIHRLADMSNRISVQAVGVQSQQGVSRSLAAGAAVSQVVQ